MLIRQCRTCRQVFQDDGWPDCPEHRETRSLGEVFHEAKRAHEGGGGTPWARLPKAEQDAIGEGLKAVVTRFFADIELVEKGA